MHSPLYCPKDSLPCNAISSSNSGTEIRGALRMSEAGERSGLILLVLMHNYPTGYCWTSEVVVNHWPSSFFSCVILRGSQKKPKDITFLSLTPVIYKWHRSTTFLYFTGLYKSQEARLMLHIYLIKAPSHTSLNKLKEEKWAMDGFVSTVSAKYNTVLIANDGLFMRPEK